MRFDSREDVKAWKIPGLFVSGAAWRRDTTGARGAPNQMTSTVLDGKEMKVFRLRVEVLAAAAGSSSEGNLRLEPEAPIGSRHGTSSE